MVFDSNSFESILTQYKDGKQWLNGVKVEIVGGEAHVDPLALLRAYEAGPSVATNHDLAQSFCARKQVRFTRGDKVLLEFVYIDGDISRNFEDTPYLLDLLHQFCFALLVKKLTPPSENSSTEERA